MKPRHLLLAALGAAMLVATACGGGATSSPTSGSGFSGRPDTSGGGSGSAKGPGTGAPAVVAPNAPQPGVSITEGPKVIRTGEMTVEVKRGGFDSSYQAAVDTVTALGGYIQSASAQADQGPLQAGTITFAIPADRFQLALDQLRKLGVEKTLHVTGQDVSLQYVDLQARLRNAEAQRDAMLALLQKAQTVNEIITVQNQLGSITGQIEQLKGQISFFDKATSLSTLTLSLREGAAPLPRTAAPDTWGFRAAVDQALHGFVSSVNAAVIALGYAGPFLLLLGVGALLWRSRRRLAL